MSQNFLVEGLTAEILGIGSPVSFKAGVVKMAKMYCGKKCTLLIRVSRYLARRVLIGDSIFLCLELEMEPPFYVVIRATRRSSFFQCKGSEYLFFLSYFSRPWVKVWPQESNLWPSALRSSTLPTELILPWPKNNVNTALSWQFTPFGCYRGTYILLRLRFCNAMGMTCRKAPPNPQMRVGLYLGIFSTECY